jgi:glycine cleavage system regulatory protein
MTERTVLTAIGEDRPGLVEEVSEFVFVRGGGIENSRISLDVNIESRRRTSRPHPSRGRPSLRCI